MNSKARVKADMLLPPVLIPPLPLATVAFTTGTCSCLSSCPCGCNHSWSRPCRSRCVRVCGCMYCLIGLTYLLSAAAASGYRE